MKFLSTKNDSEQGNDSIEESTQRRELNLEELATFDLAVVISMFVVCNIGSRNIAIKAFEHIVGKREEKLITGFLIHFKHFKKRTIARLSLLYPIFKDLNMETKGMMEIYRTRIFFIFFTEDLLSAPQVLYTQKKWEVRVWNKDVRNKQYDPEQDIFYFFWKSK